MSFRACALASGQEDDSTHGLAWTDFEWVSLCCVRVSVCSRVRVCSVVGPCSVCGAARVCAICVKVDEVRRAVMPHKQQQSKRPRPASPQHLKSSYNPFDGTML